MQAQVKDRKFDIEATADGLVVDGKLLDWNLTEVAKGTFHVIYHNRGFQAEIVKLDPVAKTCVVKVNGAVHTVVMKDKFDLLLEKMGMSGAASAKINNVKAPMPGLIVDLKVNVGDSVNAGDPLLVLEAMKMENILKAAGAGTVKSIKVKKGDSVEKGQTLIEF